MAKDRPRKTNSAQPLHKKEKRKSKSKRPKKATAGRALRRDPASRGEEDFAALLARHIERSGVAKAALARAIQTRPQYIREIETGRKPPPTLDKVERLADALELSTAERERFLARAREGRVKPESRAYLRNMEAAFVELMEIFAVDQEDRERIRQGDFEVLVARIQEALLTAGQVASESDFLPFLQVMRYRAFLKDLLDGLDALKEDHTDEDIDWVQRELLRQMERLVGLRRGEAEIFEKLKRRR